jgi:integrase
LWEQKTGKRVQRLITDTLRKELDTYTKGWHGDVYLFRSRFGSNQPLTRAGAYKLIRKAADEVGLRHISTHSMRKTFGYFFYKKEKDVAKLQKLLNHSKPDVTMDYIGIVQDALDRSMKDFDPLA